MALSLALWVQSTDFFTYLRGSSYAYPSILSLHMAALALFGGMILMTDLRLLGWAMRSRPVSDVFDQLRSPKRIGFAVAAACGILMLCCKAEEYYYNAFFWTKMSLLALVGVHALVFRRSVYNRAAELDHAPRMPGRAKLAGGISLLLWIGIACAGRGIGYIEVPFGIHATRFEPGTRHSGAARTSRWIRMATTAVAPRVRAPVATCATVESISGSGFSKTRA
jgi:hypothetical protein